MRGFPAHLLNRVVVPTLALAMELALPAHAQGVPGQGVGPAEGDARARFSERVREQVAGLVGEKAIGAAQCSDALRELILRLGDDKVSVRESASRELMASGHGAAEILACLREARFDLEVRVRALSVVVDRVVLAPRGALGVSMQPATIGNRPGVTIQELISGLPAERVLRVGDRLFQIDGLVVTSNEECIAAIQSHDPGDLLRVKVARPRRGADGKALLDANGLPVEEELEFSVELGSDDALDQANRARGSRRSPQNFGDERRRAVLELIAAWLPEARQLPLRSPRDAAQDRRSQDGLSPKAPRTPAGLPTDK